MKSTENIQQADNNKNSLPSMQEVRANPFGNRRLIEIFEGGRNPGDDPLPEILNIFTSISPATDTEFLEQVHRDVTLIFQGKYKNFLNSTAKYHDLRHTRNVTLATVRLLHGLSIEKVVLPPNIVELAVVCAYFHDTGILLTNEDAEEAGSTYLKHHEERSVTFLSEYLHENRRFEDHIDALSSVILCTNLTLNPETQVFPSKEFQLIGSVLGSADILAQMADRYYLESLPLLYQEQLDAGIEEHDSSLELMRQTTKFYHEVIDHRLSRSFNNICTSMRTHFREWWGLDRNLYLEHIEKNIKYLEYVVSMHDSGEGGIYNYLKRNQPQAD